MTTILLVKIESTSTVTFEDKLNIAEVLEGVMGYDHVSVLGEARIEDSEELTMIEAEKAAKEIEIAETAAEEG